MVTEVCLVASVPFVLIKVSRGVWKTTIVNVINRKKHFPTVTRPNSCCEKGSLCNLPHWLGGAVKWNDATVNISGYTCDVPVWLIKMSADALLPSWWIMSVCVRTKSAEKQQMMQLLQKETELKLYFYFKLCVCHSQIMMKQSCVCVYILTHTYICTWWVVGLSVCHQSMMILEARTWRYFILDAQTRMYGCREVEPVCVSNPQEEEMLLPGLWSGA